MQRNVINNNLAAGDGYRDTRLRGCSCHNSAAETVRNFMGIGTGEYSTSGCSEIPDDTFRVLSRLRRMRGKKKILSRIAIVRRDKSLNLVAITHRAASLNTSMSLDKSVSHGTWVFEKTREKSVRKFIRVSRSLHRLRQYLRSFNYNHPT